MLTTTLLTRHHEHTATASVDPVRALYEGCKDGTNDSHGNQDHDFPNIYESRTATRENRGVQVMVPALPSPVLRVAAAVLLPYVL